MKERRGRRIAAAVTIFLAAIALQRACTQPWGRAAATDGTTYEMSAVGLSRLDRAAAGVRTDCRWWPRYGDVALCAAAPAGEAPHRRLRLAYPLLQVALWLAVASLFFQALRVPRQRPLQALVPLATGALSGGAMVVMSLGARDGLAALAGTPMHFAEQGYLGALVAVILSAISTLLVAVSFSGRPDQPPPP